MKTTSGKITRRPQWTGLLAAAALLGTYGFGTDAIAGALGGDRRVCESCRTTTQLVFESELAGATAEYLLEKSKASTLPTSAERRAAREVASANFDEKRQEVRDQRKARIAICQLLDECRYNPVIDPANFLTPAETAAAPNPYLPLIPGTLSRFQNVTPEGTEIIEVSVTRKTRLIQGVTCIEVRDTVSLSGALVEDTRDWYAQDKAGNVWYFGELVLNYLNGEIVNLGGSWEAGVAGAKPGIAMKAAPQVGDVYRQEYLIGEAEDCAQVVALNETVTVIQGTFTNCRKTAEFLPFQPDSVIAPAHKFYAPNIGFILELKPDGAREELIAIEHF